MGQVTSCHSHGVVTACHLRGADARRAGARRALRRRVQGARRFGSVRLGSVLGSSAARERPRDGRGGRGPILRPVLPRSRLLTAAGGARTPAGRFSSHPTPRARAQPSHGASLVAEEGGHLYGAGGGAGEHTYIGRSSVREEGGGRAPHSACRGARRPAATTGAVVVGDR